MEKKTFLLADDDVDDRELFCEALTSIDGDIICHTVADGREALITLNGMTEPPRLIFLDINMPLMDGWQCLKILKGDERHNDIPVVIISTSSHQREMDIAKDLGALCYFTKPNDFNELTRVLRTIATNLGPGLISALHACGSEYVHVL